MRVRDYIYNSAAAPDHVAAVREALADREDVDPLDVGAADDREAALREAMLTLRESVRIGENPDAIYDDDGEPDFTAGVLITEDETGRRHLHVGPEALDALAGEDDEV